MCVCVCVCVCVSRGCMRFHVYLIAWLLIRDHWVHAIPIRQSSDR